MNTEFDFVIARMPLEISRFLSSKFNNCYSRIEKIKYLAPPQNFCLGLFFSVCVYTNSENSLDYLYRSIANGEVDRWDLGDSIIGDVRITSAFCSENESLVSGRLIYVDFVAQLYCDNANKMSYHKVKEPEVCPIESRFEILDI